MCHGNNTPCTPYETLSHISTSREFHEFPDTTHILAFCDQSHMAQVLTVCVTVTIHPAHPTEHCTTFLHVWLLTSAFDFILEFLEEFTVQVIILSYGCGHTHMATPIWAKIIF